PAVPTRRAIGRKPDRPPVARSLRGKRRSPSGAPGLAAPGTPVASGGEEVAVRGDGLLVRRRAVSVQLPRVGAHLEEPEVLAVPSRRAEARLAPRDLDRLVAIAVERVADRRLRREPIELSSVAGLLSTLPVLDDAAEPVDCLLCLGETDGRLPHRGVRGVPGVSGGERRMVVGG